MKKICHILLMTYFQDGLGYQENILSKKHVQLGFEVFLISVARQGEQSVCYTNADGVHIVILPHYQSFFSHIPFIRGMVPRSIGLKQKLVELDPDILFVHGVDFPEVLDIVSYKRQNPFVQIFADNHQDYYNSPINSIKQRISSATYLKYYARTLSKVCNVFWGVSPWRIDYLIDVFGIPRSKTGLLVMGGDDDYIDWNHRDEIRNIVRKQYNIPEDAFVIVTGGRIDLTKNVHILEETVHKSSANLYCFVFGSFTEEVNKLCECFNSDRIIHLGWINSNDVYNYFFASDLAVFPGTHSVLWEQACASGIPAIFKDWDGGFNHVDVGGNCILVKDPNVMNLGSTIQRVMNEKDLYNKMLIIAQNKARHMFSYLEIAKKAIKMDVQ